MALTAKGMVTCCLAAATHFTGLAALIRRLTRDKVPILTYHSVSAAEGEEPSCLDLVGMRLTRSEFRTHMEYVARHYNPVTVQDFVRWRSGQAALPRNPCVITFDDGYVDAYENAVPVLEELDLKATFFIIGSPTSRGELPWLHAIHEILDTVSTTHCASAFHNAAPDFFATSRLTKSELCQRVWHYFLERDRPTRRRFLDAVRAELGSEAQRAYRFFEDRHVRDLSDRGFEIGCHSMDHEYMSRLSNDELQADVYHCKEVLTRIMDRAPTLFCYPFGMKDSFDARVIETLKQEGFVCACTTTSGLNDRATDPFTLYRIDVYPYTSLSLFVFRLLGLEAASRRLYRRFTSSVRLRSKSTGG